MRSSERRKPGDIELTRGGGIAVLLIVSMPVDTNGSGTALGLDEIFDLKMWLCDTMANTLSIRSSL